jgi:hypothetical protein
LIPFKQFITSFGWTPSNSSTLFSDTSGLLENKPFEVGVTESSVSELGSCSELQEFLSAEEELCGFLVVPTAAAVIEAAGVVIATPQPELFCPIGVNAEPDCICYVSLG